MIKWVGVGLVVAIAGGLAVTNPSQEQYAQVAGQRLGNLLKDEACGAEGSSDRGAVGEFLGGQCRNLVDAVTPELGRLIEGNTQRSNYGLASHFQTRISFEDSALAGLVKDLPTYEAAAVGVGTQVIIYRFEKR
ncbi:MAG: hypothetical protein Fur0042_22200 [Cyanophyceae cyanobacterium]